MTQEAANIGEGDYDQTASQRERMIKTRAFFFLSLELVLGKRIKMTGTMNIKKQDWGIPMEGHTVQTDTVPCHTLFRLDKWLNCFNYSCVHEVFFI